jgi:hypothetical protein
MSNTSQPTSARPARRQIDPLLAGILAGAALLIVAGLIAIPLLARRAPTLAPDTTPEGVTQRFYQAIFADDYAAAHAYLASTTRAQISQLELQQQLSSQLRQSQVRVVSTTTRANGATVQVVITHVTSGDLFGANEWTEDREVLLLREGADWKIVGGPFYVPLKP